MLLCAISFMAGSCKKSGTTSTQTQTRTQFLIGTFPLTKVEASNTNNGTDWQVITAGYTSNQIGYAPFGNTFSADGTVVNVSAFITQNGTWSVSTDGNTLTMFNNVYTISTLDAHNLVIYLGSSATYSSGNNGMSYHYLRFSYYKI